MTETYVNNKTELENALKMGLNKDSKSEEVLELENDKRKLESKQSTLVAFLECAQNSELTQGLFYTKNLFDAKVLISDLGEEAQELWRKFHDKLCEAVMDYKTVLQQEISEIEDKIKELKR